MTKEEAEKVIGILMQADNECKNCVRSLMEMFVEDFPDHADAAKERFLKRYCEVL